MEIKDATIVILGGSGMVGQAVARRLLDYSPAKIVLVALKEDEVERAAKAIRVNAGSTAIEVAWGNVFYPASVAQLDRSAVLDHAERRQLVLDDLLGDLTEDVVRRSLLFQILDRYRPDAVIDCINTATAFAYLDSVASARQLRRKSQGDEGVTRDDIDSHVLTLGIPALIRHMQILSESLKRAKTSTFVKIGTSGTGGMGFNIPYTHSEERPSRTLLAKSALAGAHSVLLFLMGRTPGAPATIEVKPAAAVGWRDIAFGPIVRRGRQLPLVDCPEPMPLARAFDGAPRPIVETGKPVEAAYVDVGENGVFAADEFEIVTSLGQMELITCEEVAELVVLEMRGHPTGRDIVAALDGSVAGPTYQGGLLRQFALERLRELECERNVRSIGFEMLGPPRLTKLLYEAYMLSQLCESVEGLAEADADGLVEQLATLVSDNADLRMLIISVGLPVLLPDGESVYVGSEVVMPPAESEDAASVAPRGWVDLRSSNVRTWIERARRIVQQAEEREKKAEGTGSNADWLAIDPTSPIRPPHMARWIFRYEDHGERYKR